MFSESASWNRVISAEVQRLMANLTGAWGALEIHGASHAIPVPRPEPTAELILEAAALPVAACPIPTRRS